MKQEQKRNISLGMFFSSDMNLAIPKSQLTKPSRWINNIVCIDNCEICPLADKGCAKQCNRFTDLVCIGCPCANHSSILNKDELGYDKNTNVKDVREARESNLPKEAQYRKGEEHIKAKLTEEQVREIRRKYVPKKYSYQRLGEEYGVGKTTIREIVQRKIWTHID